jgi:hypothetical protein
MLMCRLITEHRSGEVLREDMCKQLPEVVFGMLLDSQHHTRSQLEVRRSWQWTKDWE